MAPLKRSKKTDKAVYKKSEELLDKLYSVTAEGKKIMGPQPATGTVIHWWGQFSFELPEPFYLDGGHGYLKTENLKQATETAEKLRSSIFKKWKGTKEWADKGWYRWMLPAPDYRQMTLEFLKSLPQAK